MSDDERGALITRFEVDPADERMLARMRLVIALVALGAASVTLLGALPLPVFMVALVGVLVSLAWLGQARRARHRASHAASYFLAVYTGGFELAEGAAPKWVPWREIRDIEVDEDRLDVVITLGQGPPLRMEPR